MLRIDSAASSSTRARTRRGSTPLWRERRVRCRAGEPRRRRRWAAPTRCARRRTLGRALQAGVAWRAESRRRGSARRCRRGCSSAGLAATPARALRPGHRRRVTALRRLGFTELPGTTSTSTSDAARPSAGSSSGRTPSRPDVAARAADAEVDASSASDVLRSERTVGGVDAREPAGAERLRLAVAEANSISPPMDEVELLLALVEWRPDYVARRQHDRVDAERGHAERARGPCGSPGPSPSPSMLPTAQPSPVYRSPSSVGILGACRRPTATLEELLAAAHGATRSARPSCSTSTACSRRSSQQPDDAHMPETHAPAADRGRQALRRRGLRVGPARVRRAPDRLARLDRLPRLARLGGAARRARSRPSWTASCRPGRGACRTSPATRTARSCAGCACGSRTRRRSPRCTGAACPTRRTPQAAVERRRRARPRRPASRRTGAARCSRSARRCGSTRAPGSSALLRDTDLAAALYVGDDVTDLDAFRGLSELRRDGPPRHARARRRALRRGPAGARARRPT